MPFSSGFVKYIIAVTMSTVFTYLVIYDVGIAFIL